MITYEVIANLCKEQNIAITALERELGFSNGSIGKLKKGGSLSFKRLQKIADYFNVSVDCFTKPSQDGDVSTERSVNIDEEIQVLIDYLSGGRAVYCYGEVMSEEGKLALLNSMKQDKEFLTALYKKDNINK